MSTVTVHKEGYDSQVGRWVRNVKSNDPFNLVGADVTGAAAAILASVATDANHHAVITGITVMADSTGDIIALTAGNTTILAFRMTADIPYTVVTTKDAPIFTSGTSTTLNLVAVTAGTYTAAVWGFLEPRPTRADPN